MVFDIVHPVNAPFDFADATAQPLTVAYGAFWAKPVFARKVPTAALIRKETIFTLGMRISILVSNNNPNTNI
ncbi:hypothetical protein AIOL_002080 [Candidatus Rhodobacter oscarellae]|uniref:Uncharacterized protein n=1 Tax=Candidatus Rhodobacter oscarellae TaxID=1675527 RepID=A0A0J9E2Q6_9RHOB|nr:hypothetical protein AIOL_002080 [Candidatus Rhodobacter lobularis]